MSASSSSSPNRRTTRADVARRAGVSPAAVSAVLSGNTYPTVSISEPTRDRIRAAARDLDYRPNLIARSLKQQRSMLIAFLCRPAYHRSHEIMLGMQETLDATDYSLVHYSRGETLRAEHHRLELCWERRVDGVVLTPVLSPAGRTNLRRVLEMVERGVPIVQLPTDPLPEIPSVTIDFAAAAQQAADHLLGLGHQRIALLTTAGHQDQTDPAQRSHPSALVNAYEQHLRVAGLEPIVLACDAALGSWRRVDDLLEQEMDLAQMVLTHPARPTAVITSIDYLAVALLRALARMQRPVPESLSVLGMHNTRVGRMSLPTLTTLDMHHEHMGSVAAAMVRRQIEGETVESEQVRPSLIVRESTGPPPAR